MKAIIDICCVKWGLLYSSDYVNKLSRSLNKYTAIPIRFHCFTDDATGLDSDIKTHDLPRGLHGWYNKIYLFKDGLFEGRVAFFDLDTIIIDNIDDILLSQEDFLILRDFYRPKEYGSAIMIWNPENYTYIWEEYKRQGFPFFAKGDQEFIYKQLEDPTLLQDKFNSIKSFKVHCKESLPKETKIVCFHGNPKPHHLKEGRLYEEWNS